MSTLLPRRAARYAASYAQSPNKVLGCKGFTKGESENACHWSVLKTHPTARIPSSAQNFRNLLPFHPAISQPHSLASWMYCRRKLIASSEVHGRNATLPIFSGEEMQRSMLSSCAKLDW